MSDYYDLDYLKWSLYTDDEEYGMYKKLHSKYNKTKNNGFWVRVGVYRRYVKVFYEVISEDEQKKYFKKFIEPLILLIRYNKPKTF